MKYHVQFLDKDLKGNTVDAMGSDGVFILDGRNTLETMMNDAVDRKHQLRIVHKYVGWSIRQGDRLDNATEIARYEELN